MSQNSHVLPYRQRLKPWVLRRVRDRGRKDDFARHDFELAKQAKQDCRRLRQSRIL